MNTAHRDVISSQKGPYITRFADTYHAVLDRGIAKAQVATAAIV